MRSGRIDEITPAASPWLREHDPGPRMTGALLLDLLDGGPDDAALLCTRRRGRALVRAARGRRRRARRPARGARHRARRPRRARRSGPVPSSSSCCSRSRRSAPRPRRSTRPTAATSSRSTSTTSQPRAAARCPPASSTRRARRPATRTARRRRDARAGRRPLALAGRRPSARARSTAAEPDDIALLLHTSGTTSRPKQVPLLHRNLTASARTIAAPLRAHAATTSRTARCRCSTCTASSRRRSAQLAGRRHGRRAAARRAARASGRSSREHGVDLVLGRARRSTRWCSSARTTSGPTACASASRGRAARRSRRSWPRASRATSACRCSRPTA